LKKRKRLTKEEERTHASGRRKGNEIKIEVP